MTQNALDRITFRGHTFDRLTVAAIEYAEAELGHPLTIAQGSYNNTVGASAGTHKRGGAADFAQSDDHTRNALRKAGFAAWTRLPIPGLWAAHTHAILIGHPDLDPTAAAQVVDYHKGRNGLASHLVDRTWRPTKQPIFTWQGITRGHNADTALLAAKAGLRASKTAARRRAFRKALDALQALPLLPKGRITR